MFTVKHGTYGITGECGKDPQDPYSGWWVVKWDTLRPRHDAPLTCSVYATDKRCPKSLRAVKRSRGRKRHDSSTS